jgi:acyl carrier protein
MERAKVADRLRQIVAEVAEIDVDSVGDDQHFVKDLDLDSMMLLEIAAAVEKEYKITIEESQLTKLTTINQAIDVAQQFGLKITG